MADQVRVPTNNNLTIKKVDNLKSSFELDLIAFYNVLQDKVNEMLNKGLEEGWTPDRIIEEIDNELRH